MSRVFSLLILFQVYFRSEACLDLQYFGNALGNLTFSQLPIEDPINNNVINTGRPTYKATDASGKALYLFHLFKEETYSGRWVISSEVSDSYSTVVAFIESWAVAPYLARDVTNRYEWTSVKGDVLSLEPQTKLVCDSDETLYFDTHPVLGFDVGGYYVLRKTLVDTKKFVFSHINLLGALKTQAQQYLYYLKGKWLIGNKIGVDCK